MKKNILITGSSSIIGKYLKELLSEQGFSVLTAGRNDLDDIYMDFSKPEMIANLKVNKKINVCIHLAGANETYDGITSSIVNIVGTNALLNFCKKNNINNFIFTSTMHVFGNLRGVLTEKGIPKPITNYGLSNYLAEQYVDFFSVNQNMNTSVLRLGNVYGIPKDLNSFNRWKLVPFLFPKEAIQTQKIELNTSGEQIRNFIDVRDVCNLIRNLVELEEYPRLLHVHGYQNLSIKEFAELVSRKCYEKMRLNVAVSTKADVNKLNDEKVYEFKSELLTNFYQPLYCIENFVEDFISILHENIGDLGGK